MRVFDSFIISNIFVDIFRPELLSDSEVEENPSSNVIVPQKLVSRGNIVGTQSSIRLSELGPRLTLQVNHNNNEACIPYMLYYKKVLFFLVDQSGRRTNDW